MAIEAAELEARKAAARDFLIDVGLGHTIPFSELEKLAPKTIQVGDKKEPIYTVVNAKGDEIPLEVAAKAETAPEFMKIRLPEGETRTYQIIQSQINETGFKAVAYREVRYDAGKGRHVPVLDNQQRTQIRMSLQGYVAGDGDFDTAVAIFKGQDPSHPEETKQFVRDAIATAGGADKVSGFVLGTHSYGKINVAPALEEAWRSGVKDIKTLIAEPYGAEMPLQAYAQSRAREELGTRALQAAVDERATAILEEANITVLEPYPPSAVTLAPGGGSKGLPGKHYVVDLRSVASGGGMGLVKRHRAGTMAQAIANGVLPQDRSEVEPHHSPVTNLAPHVLSGIQKAWLQWDKWKDRNGTESAMAESVVEPERMAERVAVAAQRRGLSDGAAARAEGDNHRRSGHGLLNALKRAAHLSGKEQQAK